MRFDGKEAPQSQSFSSVDESALPWAMLSKHAYQCRRGAVLDSINGATIFSRSDGNNMIVVGEEERGWTMPSWEHARLVHNAVHMNKLGTAPCTLLCFVVRSLRGGVLCIHWRETAVSIIFLNSTINIDDFGDYPNYR